MTFTPGQDLPGRDQPGAGDDGDRLRLTAAGEGAVAERKQSHVELGAVRLVEPELHGSSTVVLQEDQVGTGRRCQAPLQGAGRVARRVRSADR